VCKCRYGDWCMLGWCMVLPKVDNDDDNDIDDDGDMPNGSEC
jgi:hypothetical protein